MGFTFRNMGRPAEALQSYEQARALQEALARDHPATARYREVLSWTYSNLGVIHLELDHPVDAIHFHRRAIAIHEELVARDPGNPHLRSDLAWAWRYLGLARAASGDLETAQDLVERAVELTSGSCGVISPTPRPAGGWPGASTRWGGSASRSGRPAEAAGRWSGPRSSSWPWTARTRCSTGSTSSAINSTSPPSASSRASPRRPKECICKAEEVLHRPSKISPELQLFDMACAYGLWSVAGLDGAIAAAEREPRARRAIAALRRAALSGPAASTGSVATRSSTPSAPAPTSMK